MEGLSVGVSLVQIVWINLLLSGDNAMVIALACRSLSGAQRRIGIVLGAGAAVGLRIVFTAVISEVLDIPWVRAVGALLLLWIAVKLLVADEEGEASVAGHASLWRAVWTVMVADAVMSLDNVVAIAAAAKGSTSLIVAGLALSVPIVVAGSTLIVAVIARFPVLVWAGAAFLGWIAGDMLMSDTSVARLAPDWLPPRLVAALSAVLVVGLGWVLGRAGRG